MDKIFSVMGKIVSVLEINLKSSKHHIEMVEKFTESEDPLRKETYFEEAFKIHADLEVIEKLRSSKC